jgi:putative FmdB family regulatory protein
MSTWVYRCEECDITFAVEAEEGAQAPETAVCRQCGSTEAKKQFELPKPAGGCACGGNCC